MKKIAIIVVGALGFVFPSIAQVSHDFDPTDREPVVTAKLKKEQVPEQVLKAVNTQFDKNNPLTWSKFPYKLKEYGWVYDVNSPGNNLDSYLVTMKTTDGKDFQAVYTADGSLVESREMSVNVIIPKEVMKELQNSAYKDWNIVGNKEIIKYYRDRNNINVEQHFRITVEKENLKKSISFDWNGSN